MKISFLLLAVLVGLFGCKKEKLPDGTPQCIKDKIEEFAQLEDSKTVRRIEVQGESHYWFNNDAIDYDGLEYILNDACDTVCYFCGECSLPICLEIYSGNEWEIIWKK